MDPQARIAELEAERMMPEKAWQRIVLDLARVCGWTWYHTWDSRRSQPGFPDLCLVRDRVIFAELKRDGGRLTHEQVVWIANLEAAGAEVYVWRPENLEEVRDVLTRRER